ncbi:hypothetical protein JJ691_54460 [Kutzneria sp. CA-103260]|nr:hypothetical protein JJ691_54460 [Kutzneria sp. CA-103260]
MHAHLDCDELGSAVAHRPASHEELRDTAKELRAESAVLLARSAALRARSAALVARSGERHSDGR